MKIGIKFCGGCNSRYDRSGEVQKLKKRIADAEWITGREEEICDYWLIVCGCSRGCVDTEALLAKKEILWMERPIDFKKAETVLLQNAVKESQPVKKVLRPGMKASMKKVITKEMVTAFAGLTEDYNKMHTDAGFAAGQLFLQPVAHGMLVSALLSTVMGMQLPGEGTILMEEQSKFCRPVYFGDEITAEVTLSGYREEKRFYIGELKGVCRNQKGESVIEMTAKQMMMKHLFEIREDNDDESGKI